MRISDWSSDVCSSDLRVGGAYIPHGTDRVRRAGRPDQAGIGGQRTRSDRRAAAPRPRAQSRQGRLRQYGVRLLLWSVLLRLRGEGEYRPCGRVNGRDRDVKNYLLLGLLALAIIPRTQPPTRDRQSAVRGKRMD